MYSTEMFQPVNPFARSHVVVQDVGAWRNRGLSYVLRRGCHQKRPEFDECFRPSTWIHVLFPAVRRVQCANYVHCGTSKAKYCLALRALATLAISSSRQCSASGVLQELVMHQICPLCQPMPTLSSGMQDTRLFCCVCRFIFSESSCLQVTFRNQAVSAREESRKKHDKQISSTSYSSSPTPRRKKILKFFLHCLWRSRFPTCACFRVHTVSRTFNFDGFWLK